MDMEMDTTDTGSINHTNNLNRHKTNNSIPLRASCDRCRAHKLRCVPWTTADSKAPCQRCVKAAVATTCVFGRTGRYRKASVDDSTVSSTNHDSNGNNKFKAQDLERNHVNNINTTQRTTKENNTSFPKVVKPSFPGMGTFALPTSSKVSSSAPYKEDIDIATHNDPNTYNNDQHGSSYLDTNSVNMSGVLDMFPDSWDPETLINAQMSMADLTRQSSGVFAFGDHSNIDDCEEIINPNVNSRSGSSSRMEPALISMPPTPQSGYAANLPSQSSMIVDMTTSKPGVLNELAVLLSEMPSYEERLSKHLQGNLLTYPIGDAIYLTLRFRAILTGRSDFMPLTSSAPGKENMPAMLLTLSCYMTLISLYLTIFNYFASNLSMILAGSKAARHGRLNHACTADKYRGLRLDQLPPICLCAGWNPIKKAVLMLLCSLSCTEAILGLPDDVRVTVKPSEEEFQVAYEVWFEAGEEKCVMFNEELMATLMNNGLSKESNRKTMELREKIKLVEGLVVGISEMYAVSP
jgi:hypothetical protein